MLIAVFGTMVAGGICDGLHAPSVVTTLLYAIGTAAVFSVWCRREGTLSIHSITTRSRERFYCEEPRPANARPALGPAVEGAT